MKSMMSKRYIFNVLCGCILLACLLFFASGERPGNAQTDGNFSDWKIPLPAGTHKVNQGDYRDNGKSHKEDNDPYNQCALDFSIGGVDGMPVLAPADGIVIKTAYQPVGAGHYILIHHPSENVDTVYMHLQTVYVQSGKVKTGQILGCADTSGRPPPTDESASIWGPHLHFAILVPEGNAYKDCVEINSLDGNSYEHLRYQAEVISTNQIFIPSGLPAQDELCPQSIPIPSGEPLELVTAVGVNAATALPGETLTITFRVRNAGALSWPVDRYVFTVSQESSDGTLEEIETRPLSKEVLPVETLAFDINVTAADSSGVTTYLGQLQYATNGATIDQTVRFRLFVVPPEMQDFKEQVDQQLEDMQNAGEEKAEQFLEELQQKFLDLIARQGKKLAKNIFESLLQCISQVCAVPISGVFGLVVLFNHWHKNNTA